jgi:hypothetical protein
MERPSASRKLNFLSDEDFSGGITEYFIGVNDHGSFLLKHVMQQRDQNTSLQLTNAMEQSPS